MWLYGTNQPSCSSRSIGDPDGWGFLLVLVPAGFWLLAILIADSAPTASLAMHAGVPILYFVSLVLTRTKAPPGAPAEDFTE